MLKHFPRESAHKREYKNQITLEHVMKNLLAILALVLVTLATAQTKSTPPAAPKTITLKSVGIDTIAVKSNLEAITAQLEALRAEVKALRAAQTAQRAILRQARKVAGVR